MNTPRILKKIVERRRQRIAELGHDMGVELPRRRPDGLPPTDFTRKPMVICEIKRRSPSRGDIMPGLDHLKQAEIYRASGISSVSVLTEMDHFGGSLTDLLEVKQAFPELALLRKDFLLDLEDIDASWRAGADAVLLIAAILNPSSLRALYLRTRELGMQALVEVHNAEELAVVFEAGVQPRLMGINARDLNSFQVDLLAPILLRSQIDWECDVVFESGVFAPDQLAPAVRGGFTGVLVGEAAVRDPGLAARLGRGLSAPDEFAAGGAAFWTAVTARLAGRSAGREADRAESRPDGRGNLVSRPLIKICGLCREEDARLAADLGADMLGFVFADSRRRTNTDLLRAVKDIPVLKIAVVTEAPDGELVDAWKDGLIDAFQYHGDESPGECLRRGLPFYKALRLREPGEAGLIMDYSVARVLVDAWVPGHAGGTGRQLSPELVDAAAGQKPLWLAGGLNPENIAEILEKHRPELIDASSGLEAEPGRKDPVLMKRYFEEIAGASV